jgi:hypothetical protein
VAQLQAYMTSSYFCMDKTTPFTLLSLHHLHADPSSHLLLPPSLPVFSVAASSLTPTPTKWAPAAVVPLGHGSPELLRLELTCGHGGSKQQQLHTQHRQVAAAPYSAQIEEGGTGAPTLADPSWRPMTTLRGRASSLGGRSRRRARRRPRPRSRRSGGWSVAPGAAAARGGGAPVHHSCAPPSRPPPSWLSCPSRERQRAPRPLLGTAVELAMATATPKPSWPCERQPRAPASSPIAAVPSHAIAPSSSPIYNSRRSTRAGSAETRAWPQLDWRAWAATCGGFKSPAKGM